MPLSLVQAQASNELAGHLYTFLPGKPRPFVDQSISFRGVVASLGLLRLVGQSLVLLRLWKDAVLFAQRKGNPAFWPKSFSLK